MDYQGSSGAPCHPHGSIAALITARPVSASSNGCQEFTWPYHTLRKLLGSPRSSASSYVLCKVKCQGDWMLTALGFSKRQ